MIWLFWTLYALAAINLWPKIYRRIYRFITEDLKYDDWNKVDRRMGVILTTAITAIWIPATIIAIVIWLLSKLKFDERAEKIVGRWEN